MLKKIKIIAITLFARLFKLRNRKYVLFAVRNEIMLSYVLPIYNGLRNDSRLSLWFCFTNPDRFSANQIDTFKKKHTLKTISYRLAKHIDWELIIFPDHCPPFREKCHKIYTGHGLTAGKKVKDTAYIFGPRSLGKKGEIIYEKIFVNSQFIKDRIKENYSNFYPHVRVVGSLLSDQMRIEKNIDIQSLGLDINKKTIMICSTWGPHSLIQSQGHNFINEIPKIANDYNIIISVHLNNFTVSKSGCDDISGLLDRIEQTNVYINKSFQVPHLLLRNADILITDITSLGLYYPMLGRPIIFLDNQKTEFEPCALIPELRKVAYVINDFSNMRETIENALIKFNPERMKDLSLKIVSFHGQAWERHANEIYDSLSLNENKIKNE